MRIIKFRIWDGEDMLPMGESIEFRNALFHKIRVTHKYDDLREPDCKDFHLMQFTGLTDKNGKEIFEGDVLQCTTGIAYVVWEDAAFALKSQGSEAVDWEHSSYYEKCEIIGNIHEQNKD